MAEYYRYINEEELQEKDVILLVDDEVKNVDFIHPRYFKVAFSNMKKHENTTFVGKELCLFPRLVRKATEPEIALLAPDATKTSKAPKKQTPKSSRKTSVKKD